MALPKLNDTPKYEAVIPSTQQKVKFRPYLVKEEKVLLLAMESQDNKQALDAVADTVVSCIHDDIDPTKLTTFDVEYLFLKIRSKSVGEKSFLKTACQTCGQEIDFEVDIEDVEIPVKKPKSKIQLTDNISLKMRWPSYRGVTNNPAISKATSPTDQAFLIVAECIEAIQTEDENFLVKDVEHEELMEFLDSLTSEQYGKITKFVEEMPRLAHEIEVVCPEGHENKLKLEGISDFF